MTLQVDILDTQPWVDWGFNSIRDGGGSLGAGIIGGGEGFVNRDLTVPLDFDKRMALLTQAHIGGERANTTFGIDIPWNITNTGPFFGAMGTAPSLARGILPSAPPAEFGGNMDNKHMVPGSTLYLPVNVDGALFSVGDGHIFQANGEVDISALEGSLQGTFRFTVRDDFPLEGWPRADTGTHLMTMAFHPSLDFAEKAVVTDMIAWLVTDFGFSREDAYTLCSIAGDMEVTQVVDGNKGVHMLLSKKVVSMREQMKRGASVNFDGGV
jgi:acetamidase/formamidase